MNPKIIALAMFALTVGGIALYPATQQPGATGNPPVQPALHKPVFDPTARERPKIEVVFALDTTGSMGGLIQAAKEKIWSIATTMAQAKPAPEIRIGLVAYRDRGDDYVTRVFDLSEDLDTLYATLMDFTAGGGGDEAESVNQALFDAVNKVSWSNDQSAYKVVFLVGDAPPHMDYQDDTKYPQTLATAKARGIVVNTIQAGSRDNTRNVWIQIAQAGAGQYAQVEQNGSAVAIATPFDERLATLSAELDETRLYYGSAEEKAKRLMKQEAAKKLHETASVSARARRATFNATDSGETNLLGEGELVEDVASGRVDLDALPAAALPEPLKAMAPSEQKLVIEQTAKRRAELRQRIGQLAAQRADFLKAQVEASGTADASLDNQLYDTIREQAAGKGLRYDADAPAY